MPVTTFDEFGRPIGPLYRERYDSPLDEEGLPTCRSKDLCYIELWRDPVHRYGLYLGDHFDLYVYPCGGGMVRIAGFPTAGGKLAVGVMPTGPDEARSGRMVDSSWLPCNICDCLEEWAHLWSGVADYAALSTNSSSAMGAVLFKCMNKFGSWEGGLLRFYTQLQPEYRAELWRKYDVMKIPAGGKK
jgi:hypothetical protein